MSLVVIVYSAGCLDSKFIQFPLRLSPHLRLTNNTDCVKFSVHVCALIVWRCSFSGAVVVMWFVSEALQFCGLEQELSSLLSKQNLYISISLLSLSSPSFPSFPLFPSPPSLSLSVLQSSYKQKYVVLRISPEEHGKLVEIWESQTSEKDPYRLVLGNSWTVQDKPSSSGKKYTFQVRVTGRGFPLWNSPILPLSVFLHLYDVYVNMYMSRLLINSVCPLCTDYVCNYTVSTVDAPSMNIITPLVVCDWH